MALYQGYGDSIGDPNETGMVNDIITLFIFVKTIKPDSKIFIWGHSMGAA